MNTYDMAIRKCKKEIMDLTMREALNVSNSQNTDTLPTLLTCRLLPSFEPAKISYPLCSYYRCFLVEYTLSAQLDTAPSTVLTICENHYWILVFFFIC